MPPETPPGWAIAGLLASRGDGETLDMLCTLLKAVEVDSTVLLFMPQSESSSSWHGVIFAILNLEEMPTRDPALLLAGIHSDERVTDPTLSQSLFEWDMPSIQVSLRRLMEVTTT